MKNRSQARRARHGYIENHHAVVAVHGDEGQPARFIGNSPELIRAVIESGQNHGESYWELPLPEEYREMLRTPNADLNNIGGVYAGASTAGLFLQEFVPDGARWAHLDIAGPFMRDKNWKYYEPGGIGFGTKTLVDLAERFGEYF
jgi:leucyl aminopeptidase